MTPRWHSITCRTCHRVLASGLFPPGADTTETAVRLVAARHRALDHCFADHVTLEPCTQADVEARLLEDARRESGA